MANTLGRAQQYALFSAASATANSASVPVGDAAEGGYAFAVFQISGTFSATVAFKGTVDGTNWVTLEATSVGDSSSIITTTASAAGAWRVVCAGMKYIRAELTWTSGTSITVWVGLLA